MHAVAIPCRWTNANHGLNKTAQELTELSGSFSIDSTITRLHVRTYNAVAFTVRSQPIVKTLQYQQKKLSFQYYKMMF